MLLPALTYFPVKFLHGTFHTFAYLTFAFRQITRPASHFIIMLHQQNLFCHPALSQRPAHDPCFTLKLGSNKAEGRSRWVRRNSSIQSCSVLLFHTGDDREIQYAECTPIPGLPENVGVVPDARDNADHCSLTPRQSTKGWLRLSCSCSSSFPRGSAAAQSLTASLPRGAMGKSAYQLCQFLRSPAGWNTSLLCVQQLHQSPDVSAWVPSTIIITATPPMVAMEGAQNGGDHWHQNHPVVQQHSFALAAYLKSQG